MQEGERRTAGIHVQDARMIRLLEVLLHAGSAVGGRSSLQIHEAILGRFEMSAVRYTLNSLRYDLRKLKGYGLLEREPGRYAYRLTERGQRVAILMMLFQQRLCGPVAGSHVQQRPNERYCPQSARAGILPGRSCH